MFFAIPMIVKAYSSWKYLLFLHGTFSVQHEMSKKVDHEQSKYPNNYTISIIYIYRKRETICMLSDYNNIS